MNHPAQQSLEKLRRQHEATMARVKALLPQVYGISIDEVPNAEWDHANGIIYGELISEGVKYNFRFGDGAKELTTAND